VSGDDRFAFGSDGIESGWDQVCKRLSHTGARFNNEVIAGFERSGHIAGHLSLLGPKLVIRCPRKPASGREYVLDLRLKGAAPSTDIFPQRDHDSDGGLLTESKATITD
jgi:hypothetical protein